MSSNQLASNKSRHGRDGRIGRGYRHTLHAGQSITSPTPQRCLRTGDRRIDVQHVGLLPQDLCAFLQYVQRLLLAQPPFAVEVVFEEGDVGFGRIGGGEELGCGGDRG